MLLLESFFILDLPAIEEAEAAFVVIHRCLEHFHAHTNAEQANKLGADDRHKEEESVHRAVRLHKTLILTRLVEETEVDHDDLNRDGGHFHVVQLLGVKWLEFDLKDEGKDQEKDGA